jgi:hypothetical protein
MNPKMTIVFKRNSPFGVRSGRQIFKYFNELNALERRFSPCCTGSERLGRPGTGFRPASHQRHCPPPPGLLVLLLICLSIFIFAYFLFLFSFYLYTFILTVSSRTFTLLGYVFFCTHPFPTLVQRCWLSSRLLIPAVHLPI